MLVDHGSGMVPYRRDAAWLANEIERLVGSGGSTMLRFRGLPSHGVADPRRKTRRPYTPPPSGVPVVLITDFGISVDDLATDRVTGLEWIAFLRELRRSNDAVLAFVPYPKQRCPRWVADFLTIIEFDRHTTLMSIRAAITNTWRRR
jgi:hypothetical protein